MSGGRRCGSSAPRSPTLTRAAASARRSATRARRTGAASRSRPRARGIWAPPRRRPRPAPRAAAAVAASAAAAARGGGRAMGSGYPAPPAQACTTRLLRRVLERRPPEAFRAGEAGERCNGMMLHGSEVAVRRDGLKRWTICSGLSAPGPRRGRPTTRRPANSTSCSGTRGAVGPGRRGTTLLCESRQCRSFRFAPTHATSRLAEQMHAEQLVQGAAEAERARAESSPRPAGCPRPRRRSRRGARARASGCAMARLAEQRAQEARWPSGGRLGGAAGGGRRAAPPPPRASLARAGRSARRGSRRRPSGCTASSASRPRSPTAAIRLVPDETAQTLVGRACAALGVAPKPKFEAVLRGRLRSAAALQGGAVRGGGQPSGGGRGRGGRFGALPARRRAADAPNPDGAHTGRIGEAAHAVDVERPEGR